MSESNPSGFSVTQKVVRNSSLMGVNRLVATAIADRYEQSRGYSQVSTNYIVNNFGISKATVSQAIKEMLASGEWLAEKSHGLSTRYFPVMDKLDVAQPRVKPATNRGKAARANLNKDDENIATIADINDGSSPSPKEKRTPKTKAPTRPTTPSEILSVPESTAKVFDYPETDEDTDPYLNGLPLSDYDVDSDVRPKVVRPPVLKTSLAMAIRLHRRTDIQSRHNKRDFTVPKIKELIDLLHHQNHPLEAIDIALWIQCRDSQPLNASFIGLALSRCVKNGKIIVPTTYNSDKEDPAQNLAKEIYTVYYCRHINKDEKYVESL